MSKVIYNNIIPFKGYLCVNLFGILFVREEYKKKLNNVDLNHEAIHSAQMKELLYIPYYILYVLEWFVRLLMTFDSRKAYRSISFEQEAYDNEKDLTYLTHRKHFAQWQ